MMGQSGNNLNASLGLKALSGSAAEPVIPSPKGEGQGEGEGTVGTTSASKS